MGTGLVLRLAVCRPVIVAELVTLVTLLVSLAAHEAHLIATAGAHSGLAATDAARFLDTGLTVWRGAPSEVFVDGYQVLLV